MTTNCILTTKSITTDQIRSLRYAAREADDVVQVVLCDRALALPVNWEDWSGGGWTYQEMAKIREAAGSSTEEATEACVDAINSARAMETE